MLSSPRVAELSHGASAFTTCAALSLRPLQVYAPGAQLHHVLDTRDLRCRDWMRYINPAPGTAAQNLVACQHDRNICFYALAPILPGAELLMWPGREVAQRLQCPALAAKLGEGRRGGEVCPRAPGI